MSIVSAMFYQDVRNMKRISNYSKHNGRTNRWVDSTTGLSQKEIQKLHSEMRVYIMDNLLSKEEFYALDLDMQKQMMEHWRNTKQTSEIRKALDLSAGGFYALLQKLGLPTNIKGRFGRGNDNVVENTSDKPKAVKQEQYEEVLELLLEFNDRDTGENIMQRLSAIGGFVNDKNEYHLSLKIKKVTAR